MSRDNMIGGLFLVAMGVLAAILIRAIITGERPDISLSPTVSIILVVLFFGGIIYGVWQSGFFSRIFSRIFGDRNHHGPGSGGRQWPDPRTGEKSWWDRIRGR